MSKHKEEDLKHAEMIRRADLIMKVQMKELTATEAAEILNISRKTFYEWQERALKGMLDGLTKRPPGRPAKSIDPEKETLKKDLKTLQQRNDVLETSMEIMKIWEDVDPEERAKVFGNKKNKKKSLKKKLREKRKKKRP